MASPSDSRNLFSQLKSEEGKENDDLSILIKIQSNQQNQLINSNKSIKLRRQSQSSLFSNSSCYNNSTLNITLIQDISYSFFSYLKNLNVLNSNQSMTQYNRQPPKIEINIKASEYLPGVFDILNSDNVFINKVLSAFSIVFCEIDNLIPHNGYELLLPLIIHCSDNDDEKNSFLSQTEQEIQIAKMLPLFSSLSRLIKQLIVLSINLINQFIALYDLKSKTYNDSFYLINLTKSFDYLGKIFAFFNAINLIIKSNSCLISQWKIYRNMLRKCKDNPAQFNLSIEELKALDNKITKYTSSIFSGKLFDQCVKHIYDNTLKKNEIYFNLLSNYIQKKHSHLYSQIGKVTETNERQQLFHLISYIPYLYLIQVKEYTSIYQSIWSTQNKIANLHILMGLNFNIESFLANYKPTLNIRYNLTPNNPTETDRELFDSMMNNSKAEMNCIKYQLATWVTRMGSTLFDKQNTKEDNIIDKSKQQIKLIINGLLLLNQIRKIGIILITFYLHSHQNINATVLLNIIEALEIETIITMQFNNSLPQIAQQIGMMYSVIQNKMINQLIIIKEKVIKTYKHSFSYQSDVIAALDIFTVNLDMVPSHLRIIVYSLCFDIIKSTNIPQSIKDDIEHSIWELELLSDLTYQIQSQKYSAYLIRNSFPDCFKLILNNPHENHLTNFLLSVTNSASILSYSLHKENETLIQNYQKRITYQFEQCFLNPIALEIDKDIRLQIAFANIRELNNEKQTLPDYSFYLSFELFPLFNTKIDIKGYVDEYLNKSFYELNALNPKDWKTYQQMKSFAKMKYDLSLIDSFLPIEVIDQGINLLEIVKSLPKFIKAYNYDLLNQLFIEEAIKDKKRISIVSSNQFVNTFRTHSIGIINSIVNKIFQLIGNQLKRIIAILVDDKISSIIYKEKLFWDECSSKYNTPYPYVKAHKFLKDNEELISSLVIIITQIGNAIALVRTIKTALMTYIENSTKYSSNSIRDLSFLLAKVSIDEAVNSNRDREKDDFNKTYSNAKNILTGIMKSLSTAQSSNYLYLLVSSFDNAFNIPEIEFYYILLPSCFLFHVENSIIANDNLHSKNTNEGHYINDGVILGIAYLNRVFKQEQAFESLSWFQGTNNKYEELKKKYLNDDTKTMALRRIQLLQKEFESVSWIYQTALMLFNE